MKAQPPSPSRRHRKTRQAQLCRCSPERKASICVFEGDPSSTFQRRATGSWAHAGSSEPSSGASSGDWSTLGGEAACELFQHQASGCSVAKETKASRAGFCPRFSCTRLRQGEAKGHGDRAWPWAVTRTLGGETGFRRSLSLPPNPAVNLTLGFSGSCREAAEADTAAATAPYKDKQPARLGQFLQGNGSSLCVPQHKQSCAPTGTAGPITPTAPTGPLHVTQHGGPKRGF